jgi:hypothetical protein
MAFILQYKLRLYYSLPSQTKKLSKMQNATRNKSAKFPRAKVAINKFELAWIQIS